MNTLENWTYKDGVVKGPPVPHKGYNKRHGTRAPSEIVCELRHYKNEDYQYYPKDIMLRHGYAIERVPALLAIAQAVIDLTEKGGFLHDKYPVIIAEMRMGGWAEVQAEAAEIIGKCAPERLAPKKEAK